MTKLVDHVTERLPSGFFRSAILVDHPTHGRILITQGFAERPPEGPGFTWALGHAYQWGPRDTMPTGNAASYEPTGWADVISGYSAPAWEEEIAKMQPLPISGDELKRIAIPFMM